MAQDLSAAAREAASCKQAILLVFTLPNCRYCEIVMRDFLAPLLRDPEYRGKVAILQIEMDSPSPLKGFQGEPTTHETFAKRYQVRVAPTVKLFSPAGREAAEPLVGLLTPDFYSAYLDRAIDEALAAIRSPKLASNSLASCA